MEDLYKKLGKRIKEIREAHGLTQEKIAELLDISRPTVSQMENGDRKITAIELKRLSEIFNLSADALLDLENEPEVILSNAGTPRRTGEGRMRINVPQKNLNKFKQVLLYILN